MRLAPGKKAARKTSILFGFFPGCLQFPVMIWIYYKFRHLTATKLPPQFCAHTAPAAFLCLSPGFRITCA